MLEWAKAIHEAVGIESPRLFIGVFALVGLVFFGAAGWIIDRGYRVKLREQKVQAATLVIGSTSAPKQPAVAVPAIPANPALQPQMEAGRNPAVPNRPKGHPASDVVASKKGEKIPDEAKVSQTMTNSPGGIQVGRDLNLNVNAGRRLAEGQKQMLIEEMSRSIGTNGAGLITCILGDSESAALAWDFVDVFRRAGLDLPGSGLNQAIYSAPIRGVIIKVHSREEAELPQVKRLIESLYRVGLERTGEIDPGVASGDFQIIIGAKPN